MHLALGLHSVARIMFRNHSICAHRGCKSPPLRHLDQLHCSPSNGRLLESTLAPSEEWQPSYLLPAASPDSHLHFLLCRICTQLTVMPLRSSRCQLLLWQLLAQHGTAQYGMVQHSSGQWMLFLAELPTPLPSLFPWEKLQPAPPFLSLNENYFCSHTQQE